MERYPPMAERPTMVAIPEQENLAAWLRQARRMRRAFAEQEHQYRNMLMNSMGESGRLVDKNGRSLATFNDNRHGTRSFKLNTKRSD